MEDQLSLIPIGGVSDVTKNMYVYEYGNEILIVDCGIGFADETMLGVDLLLPDISYLLKTKRRIVGMFLTHGHEDHIGALPFLLPQLPNFPIFGTPFTAALANERLKEFGTSRKVQAVPFERPSVRVGSFTGQFIRVTHSVPDTSHIFIETPVGNFYHGSDFKFDDTPFDKKVSDYRAIEAVGKKGVMCLLSDCLGAERAGKTPTELPILEDFVKEMKSTPGKCIVTTYSSNINRINQAIVAAQESNRHVCFVGRSLLKAKDAAQNLNYLRLLPGNEVRLEDASKYPDRDLMLIVAGSQGQSNSAMARIVNGEHREVKLTKNDTVIFSADPIPGNELAVYELVNEIAKLGIKVLYSDITTAFHVSGHASGDELKKLIQLTRPKKLFPIGGEFRHMAMYRRLATILGYKPGDTLLPDDGQEIIFTKNQVRFGKTIDLKTVYVDQVSGEEIENFVLRDRQKLSESGIVIVIAEIDSANGQLLQNPDIIIRGLSTAEENRGLSQRLIADLRKLLKGKKGRVTNWVYMKKLIGEVAEKSVFQKLRRRPLVLPIVIEM